MSDAETAGEKPAAPEPEKGKNGSDGPAKDAPVTGGAKEKGASGSDDGKNSGSSSTSTAGKKPADPPGSEIPAQAGKEQETEPEAAGSEVDTTHAAIIRADEAIREAERAEREAQQAAERAAAAKAAAEAATEAEYRAIAEQAKSGPAEKSAHTFKRQSEEIFRRDMDEPEFFLDKKDRFIRPVLTVQQQESLTRKAETPDDQTPEYVPQHVLSPEFEGLSNYERGVSSYLDELRGTLKRLSQDPGASPGEISATKSKIAYLESLHENYYIGMNVFRTAKGGRSKVGA